MSIRTAFSQTVRHANVLLWNGVQRTIDALPLMRWEIWTRLNHLAVVLDPDPLPCPICEEPGGAHVDCDVPGDGRMTMAERVEAFGQPAVKK